MELIVGGNMMQLALGGRDMHWSTGAGRGRRWEKGKKGKGRKMRENGKRKKGANRKRGKWEKGWYGEKGRGSLKNESPSFEISEL